MSIGKDKLTYDGTDADTIAASDTIGSATLDGAGVAITSTLVSGKQGLDVNIISDISVSIDGFYDVSTNPTPDTVGNILNTRAASPDETGQVERVTAAAASSDAVVAANVHGQDVNAFGMVYNGTTWDRLKGTSGAVNIADGGNSITVDATDLDIRDLNSATDSVTAIQGTSPWVIGDGGGSITVDGTVAVTQSTSPWVVSDAALANTALLSTAKTNLTSTPAAILAAQLSARKYLTVQNLGANLCYVGGSAVTSSTGLRLANGAMLEGLRLGPALSLFGVVPVGTADLRILEAS